MDEEVEGFRVVAQALAKLGVKYMFGVVGIPVVEVGAALHSRATPLLRGCSRKNIFCQKIFDNFFSFQATEMVLTSKWGRIQQEIQI